jgi:hypothetical protein
MTPANQLHFVRVTVLIVQSVFWIAFAIAAAMCARKDPRE